MTDDDVAIRHAKIVRERKTEKIRLARLAVLRSLTVGTLRGLVDHGRRHYMTRGDLIELALIQWPTIEDEIKRAYLDRLERASERVT